MRKTATARKAMETEKTAVPKKAAKKEKKIKVKLSILGPMQLGPGRSPEGMSVIESDEQITRIVTQESDKRGEGTFGHRTSVDFVSIIQKGAYAGHVGMRNKVTEQMLHAFWDALVNGANIRRSTMRGERHVRKLTVISYPDKCGLGMPWKFERTFLRGCEMEISTVRPLRKEKIITPIEKMMIEYPEMTDPTTRKDFILEWEVYDGCPNQDPDTRTCRWTPDERVLVTDVCTKRWLRDYWEEILELPTFMARTVRDEGKTLGEHALELGLVTREACLQVIDIALFGAVILIGYNENDGESVEPGDED